MKKIGILLLSLLVIWIYFGNTRIITRNIIIEDIDIPNSFNGFKIAHISDYHNKDWDKKIIKPLKESHVDIIAITGDLIDSRTTNTEIALDFIKESMDIAPVYYVTGNHEGRYSGYESFKREMENIGVVVLDNKSKYINSNIDSESILVMGVNDPNFTTKTSELNTNYKILKSYIDPINEEDKFSILLSHRPEQYKLYEDKNINLTLTGHAHGGQFRLPFLGAIYAPGQGFFPKYTSGLYKLSDNSKLIVSRGLGNSLIPIRINNNPDLIIIELKNSSI